MNWTFSACMKSRAQLGTVGDLAAQHEMANDCTSSGDYLSGVGGGSRYGHLQRAACAYRWNGSMTLEALLETVLQSLDRNQVVMPFIVLIQCHRGEPTPPGDGARRASAQRAARARTGVAIRTAAAGRCAPLSGPDFRAVGCGSGEAASFCGGVAEFREWAQRRNIFAMPSGAIFLNFCRVVGLCYCHEKRTLPLRPPQVHSLPSTAFDQENQTQSLPLGWLQV